MAMENKRPTPSQMDFDTYMGTLLDEASNLLHPTQNRKILWYILGMKYKFVFFLTVYIVFYRTNCKYLCTGV